LNRYPKVTKTHCTPNSVPYPKEKKGPSSLPQKKKPSFIFLTPNLQQNPADNHDAESKTGIREVLPIDYFE
jgi:hypothetical protein